jgi:hypothetical protein
MTVQRIRYYTVKCISLTWNKESTNKRINSRHNICKWAQRIPYVSEMFDVLDENGRIHYKSEQARDLTRR